MWPPVGEFMLERSESEGKWRMGDSYNGLIGIESDKITAPVLKNYPALPSLSSFTRSYYLSYTCVGLCPTKFTVLHFRRSQCPLCLRRSSWSLGRSDHGFESR
jgi:hypothetical protein